MIEYQKQHNISIIIFLNILSSTLSKVTRFEHIYQALIYYNVKADIIRHQFY